MKLHNIGKKIKGLATDQQRGMEPYKLAGSHKLPTFVVNKVRPPKITIAPPFEDKRFAAAEDYVPHFAAYFPGIDPSTGKPWSKR